MGAIASQITSLAIVFSTVYSDADQRKKASTLRVTGLCAGISPGTGEFPAQMASYAEKCLHLMTSSWNDPTIARLVIYWNHVQFST